MVMIVTSILLLVACVCGYFAKRNHRILRLIRDLPTTPIDRLKRGMAEVQGCVAAGERVLHSPMTNRECVYYHFKVDERRTRHTGKTTSSYWATVVNDRQSVDCYVEDGSGRAEVMLHATTPILDPDTRDRSGFLDEASPDLEHLLQERYGRSSKGWIFNKSMRYTETVLEAGDPLYVLGKVERRGDQVRLTKGGPILLISDKGEAAMASRYLWYAVGLGTAAVVAFGFSLAVALTDTFGWNL